MKVAHIICLAPRGLKIPDLGLNLTKGELVIRDEAVARGSKDLEHARRVGGVSVRYVQQAQTVRPREEIRQAAAAGPQRRVFLRAPPVVETGETPAFKPLSRPVPEPPKAEKPPKPRKAGKVENTDE